jgi:hypothetical protein
MNKYLRGSRRRRVLSLSPSATAGHTLALVGLCSVGPLLAYVGQLWAVVESLAAYYVGLLLPSVALVCLCWPSLHLLVLP